MQLTQMHCLISYVGKFVITDYGTANSTIPKPTIKVNDLYYKCNNYI